MLFAGLFMAYGFVRSGAAVWPPADVPLLHIQLPLLATALVVLSSAASWVAERREHRGLFAVAALLGLAFLVVQAFSARQLIEAGLTPSSGGAYGTVIYGLCVAHALHVMPGFVALAAAAIGKLSDTARAFWCVYWHFVAAVWCLLFVALFGV